MPELAQAVENYSLANFADTVIFLVGGFKDVITAEVYALNLPGQGSWREEPLPSLNEARRLHTSCTLGNELFVFGGTDNGVDNLRSETLSSIEIAQVSVDTLELS